MLKKMLILSITFCVISISASEYDAQSNSEDANKNIRNIRNNLDTRLNNKYWIQKVAYNDAYHNLQKSIKNDLVIKNFVNKNRDNIIEALEAYSNDIAKNYNVNHKRNTLSTLITTHFGDIENPRIKRFFTAMQNSKEKLENNFRELYNNQNR